MGKVVKEGVAETYTQKINKSYFFVLPFIDIGNIEIINTYLGFSEDNSASGLDSNCIFVNVDKENQSLADNSNFKDIVKLKDNTYMYKFSVPDKFNNDISLFIDGKYSLLSSMAKMKILQYEGFSGLEHIELYGILNKMSERRSYIEDIVGQKLSDDAELCSIIDLEEEIYSGE